MLEGWIKKVIADMSIDESCHGHLLSNRGTTLSVTTNLLSLELVHKQNASASFTGA